jgi:hypothetical protein
MHLLPRYLKGPIVLFDTPMTLYQTKPHKKIQHTRHKA